MSYMNHLKNRRNIPYPPYRFFYCARYYMYRVRLKLHTFPDSIHVEYYTLPGADESMVLSVICTPEGFIKELLKCA